MGRMSNVGGYQPIQRTKSTPPPPKINICSKKVKTFEPTVFDNYLRPAPPKENKVADTLNLLTALTGVGMTLISLFKKDPQPEITDTDSDFDIDIDDDDDDDYDVLDTDTDTDTDIDIDPDPPDVEDEVKPKPKFSGAAKDFALLDKNKTTYAANSNKANAQFVTGEIPQDSVIGGGEDGQDWMNPLQFVISDSSTGATNNYTYRLLTAEDFGSFDSKKGGYVVDLGNGEPVVVKNYCPGSYINTSIITADGDEVFANHAEVYELTASTKSDGTVDYSLGQWEGMDGAGDSAHKKKAFWLGKKK